MNFHFFLQNFTVSFNFDDFQPKTPGNSGELRGTPGGQFVESTTDKLRGTPGNSGETRKLHSRDPTKILEKQTNNILSHLNHIISPS